MMIAGQAALGSIGEDAADKATQRILGQKIVADMIGGHR